MVKKKRLRSEDFKARLHEAAHWEAYVAAAFTREGYYVLLGPTHVAGNPRLFAQAIDLQIRQDGKSHWGYVEVKGTAPIVDKENGTVLVCSESSFNNKAGEQGKVLYAHWVFCSPVSGKMFCLPAGTPVVRGYQHTDHERGKTYNVIKAEVRYLIPFQELIQAIRR